MSAEIKCIQMAMSEKFAMTIKAFGMVGFGVGIGFIVGWKYAFAALSFTPFYLLTLMFMGVSMKKGVKK